VRRIKCIARVRHTRRRPAPTCGLGRWGKWHTVTPPRIGPSHLGDGNSAEAVAVNKCEVLFRINILLGHRARCARHYHVGSIAPVPRSPNRELNFYLPGKWVRLGCPSGRKTAGGRRQLFDYYAGAGTTSLNGGNGPFPSHSRETT
jgi:hypothetical protein